MRRPGYIWRLGTLVERFAGLLQLVKICAHACVDGFGALVLIFVGLKQPLLPLVESASTSTQGARLRAV